MYVSVHCKAKTIKTSGPKGEVKPSAVLGHYVRHTSRTDLGTNVRTDIHCDLLKIH